MNYYNFLHLIEFCNSRNVVTVYITHMISPRMNDYRFLLKVNILDVTNKYSGLSLYSKVPRWQIISKIFLGIN